MSVSNAPSPPQAERRAALRAHAAVYLLYLAAALAITWPLLTQLSSHFIGFPFGDAHEMTRHIWWFTYALRTGQPLFFQPLLGYPDGIAGVILWSNPLQFFPAWLLAFVLPLPAAYNLTALLSLALNGWAACWLALKLTGSRSAALLAGLVFMAAPTLQGHLVGGHGGLLVQWPLPLLAYSLVRLRAEPTRRWVGLTALCLFLAPLGHTLQLIYTALPLLALFGLTLMVERRWAVLGRLALAAALGGAALLLFLLPVAGATLGTVAYTDEGGSVTFSMDLLAIFTPSFRHPLLAGVLDNQRVLGVNSVEGSGYLGVVAALLSMAGLWRARAARWWLLPALTAWVLALGPLLKIYDTPVRFTADGYSAFVTLPWAWLQDLPLLELARTPGRFNFLLALALAVMTAYGAASLLNIPLFERAIWRRGLLVAGLSALVLFEYQYAWPLPSYSADIPQAVRALADRDDVRAVFDIPWNNVLAAKDALWLQTGHHKPLIAGQVTRRTPVSPARLSLLQDTLDPALLDAAGVDVIIVHRGYDTAREAAASQRLGAPFYQDDRLLLFEAPPPSESPGFTAPGLLPAEPLAVTEPLDLPVYLPEPGWVDFSARLGGDGRGVELRVDSVALSRWTVTGDAQSARWWLPLPAGYHSVTLAPVPACPRVFDPALECPPLRIHAATFAGFTPAPLDSPVSFEQGVTLTGALVTAGPARVEVTLRWRFDQPRTGQDVRFVHVLDAAGVPVVQSDTSLGDQPAGSERLDFARLDLRADLPPGSYRVAVGWYSFPDLMRFPVVSDAPGAADGLVYVGEFAAGEDQ